MNQIGLALHDYHDEYGTFPPAYIPNEDGEPMHSWRVLILPYLERRNLYDSYRFDESWNGPNNSKLASIAVPLNQCPTHAGEFVSNYLAVAVPEAIFNGDSSPTISEITDGIQNTLIVVEVNEQSPNWMEPKDISASEFLALFNDDTDFNHEGRVNVLFADGSTSFLPSETSPSRINVLLTSQAGDFPPEWQPA